MMRGQSSEEMLAGLIQALPDCRVSAKGTLTPSIVLGLLILSMYILNDAMYMYAMSYYSSTVT